MPHPPAKSRRKGRAPILASVLKPGHCVCDYLALEAEVVDLGAWAIILSEILS
jgi:hypothetical protein